MNVYVIDHTYNGENLMNSSWGFLVNIFNVLNPVLSNDSDPPTAHVAYADAQSVFFVHVSGEEQDWRDKAGQVACHIVLLRTQGRQHEKGNFQGNLHGCYWSPGEFRNQSNTRAQMFIHQILAKNMPDVDWELLYPDSIEPILAARLLVASRDNQAKPLPGLEIRAIPEDLFEFAQSVITADRADPSSLHTVIENFESALDQQLRTH
jgi:hypothetical protein